MSQNDERIKMMKAAFGMFVEFQQRTMEMVLHSMETMPDPSKLLSDPTALFKQFSNPSDPKTRAVYEGAKKDGKRVPLTSI